MWPLRTLGIAASEGLWHFQSGKCEVLVWETLLQSFLDQVSSRSINGRARYLRVPANAASGILLHGQPANNRCISDPLQVLE